MSYNNQVDLPEFSSGSENKRSGHRNPIYIFLGFFLVGAALAILIFGRDLFSSTDSLSPAITGQSSTAVLDQVAELPRIANEQDLAAGEAAGPVDVGDRAVDFSLNDLDGNPVDLNEFKGRPVIINFWATWCAPCRIEMPELQRAYEKYQDQQLVILALDQDEPAELAKTFFYEEMGLSFTPLSDEGSVVSSQYGSFGILPSTYFVDSNGLVTAIHRGPLTLGQIDSYLAATFDSQPMEESG